MVLLLHLVLTGEFVRSAAAACHRRWGQIGRQGRRGGAGRCIGFSAFHIRHFLFATTAGAWTSVGAIDVAVAVAGVVMWCLSQASKEVVAAFAAATTGATGMAAIVTKVRWWH